MHKLACSFGFLAHPLLCCQCGSLSVRLLLEYFSNIVADSDLVISSGTEL